MFTGALFLPGIVTSIQFVLNNLAMLYDAAPALPFLHLLLMALIFIFLYIPLYSFGTILGRNVSKVEPPSKFGLVKGPIIKAKPWFAKP